MLLRAQCTVAHHFRLASTIPKGIGPGAIYTASSFNPAASNICLKSFSVRSFPPMLSILHMISNRRKMNDRYISTYITSMIAGMPFTPRSGITFSAMSSFESGAMANTILERILMTLLSLQSCVIALKW